MNLMTFFWVKSPCGLAGRSQRFGDACCLHLQGWSWRFNPKEHHYILHSRENLKYHKQRNSSLQISKSECSRQRNRELDLRAIDRSDLTGQDPQTSPHEYAFTKQNTLYIISSMRSPDHAGRKKRLRLPGSNLCLEMNCPGRGLSYISPCKYYETSLK
jgi:hypothetical protein